MSLIPNGNNSSFDATASGHHMGPEFGAGGNCFKALTYRDFMPTDLAQLSQPKKKRKFWSPLTYRDLMPAEMAPKKKMGVSGWIASILGGVSVISLLGFLGLAHREGGIFKDGIENAGKKVKGWFGIKPNGSAGNSSVLKKNLEAIPLGRLSASQCKEILFIDSKNFQQKNSQLCYLLSGLGAMVHHPSFERYLEQIRITRQPNGFEVQFPGQNYRTFHVTDDEIIKNNSVASNSPGVHLWTLAYRQCHGAIHDPNVQDDSVDALRRIFGEKDKSALVMGSQESESKWWDTVNNEWVDDDRKVREFDSTGTTSQLEKRATPIREFLERQEFEGKNRAKVLNHYLQWIKKEQNENRNHMALITAHKGGETGKFGHYYAIIPNQCDENHVCLMNTYTMGTTQQISIEQFFREGYKLYAHIDESRYPGNHWTDVHLGELWNQISSRPQETLQKRIQDIAQLESEGDQAEIQSKLTQLREAILNTEHGSLREFCLDPENVPPNVINSLNILYTRKSIPSPFA